MACNKRGSAVDRDMGNHSVWPHAHRMGSGVLSYNLRRASPSVHKDSSEQVSDQYKASNLSECYQLNRERRELC